MIISQAEIDRINSKIRQRVLQLPVRRGKFGELKRCPMRVAGVYHLTGRIPYDQHRTAAESQPSRARAVLALIASCDVPARLATVTVTAVERQGETWMVRFVKGERHELFDKDVFLSRHNDFTTAASLQTVRGDPPLMTPFAEDLAKARERALEARVSPQRATVASVRDSLSPLQQQLAQMKARNRLKLILREMDKLTDELSVDERATVLLSVCAARQVSAAVEGEPRPSGTESVLSPEAA